MKFSPQRWEGNCIWKSLLYIQGHSPKIMTMGFFASNGVKNKFELLQFEIW